MTMTSQYIELLKAQVSKLQRRDFDLEAWKTGAVITIHRIFGEGDPRAKELENLKIDYSSWMLRDSNSKYKPIETAKRKGEEILHTAIEEMEIFGYPKAPAKEILEQALTEEFWNMPDSEQERHLKRMRKNELVELLMQLTHSV